MKNSHTASQKAKSNPNSFSSIKSLALHSLGFASTLVISSVTLADESSPVETVVVTASRHATEIRNAPASISVVNREQLQLINADDLADALTAEAGLNITSVGQTRQGISFRGMPVEHTLYLIDGRRISSSNSVIAHSDYELNWLPDSAVERIEVVRGPMSSLYGADAMGGVVNIITRPQGDEFFGEISATGTRLEDSDGSGSQKTSVYLSGPLMDDTLSFNLSGQLFDRDNLANKDDANVSDIEARESTSGQGTLFWTPTENQQVIMNYSFSDDERERDMSSRAGYYTSIDNVDREQFSLSYIPQLENGHAQINAYRSTLDVENSRIGNATPTRPRSITDNIIDGNIGREFGQNHLVTIGGQLRDETLEDESLVDSQQASALHKGVFIQDEWQIGPDLLLVSGVGVDKHDHYGSEVNPRVHAVYQLSDNLTVKGGYGEGFRAPSLTELSPQYQVLAAGGRFWVEGNSELEPERSATYELGLEYALSRWSGAVRVFENQLDDLVQAVCYVNCGMIGRERRNYQNLDESRIRGSEISMNVSLLESLDLRANYTYLDSENLSTDTPLENRPQYMTRLNLNWQPLTSTRVTWRSEFNGRQFVGNNEYLPNYNLHHLDISVDFGQSFTLYAGVENILDESLADKSDLFSLTEPGRELRLGLTARF